MFSTNVLMYAILAIAAIGACVGWSNTKKGAAWGQPVTIVCALIAIGIGFYLAIQNSFGNNKETVVRETGYQKVQTKKLGLYLKEKFPGKKLLIINDPTGSEDNPKIVGLKEGIGTDLEIVKIITPEPPQMGGAAADMGPAPIMEPMEVWFTAKELEKLAKSEKFDILVSFNGIPRGVKNNGKDFLAPQFLKGKKVVIGGGDISLLKNAIEGGCIPVAITFRPEAVYDDKDVPRNLDEAFNKRYIMVTSDNVKQISEEFPKVFYQVRR